MRGKTKRIAGPHALISRCFAAVVLPSLVVMCRFYFGAGASAFHMVVACFLGCAIALGVPRGLLTTIALALSGFLIFSSVYLAELQSAEEGKSRGHFEENDERVLRGTLPGDESRYQGEKRAQPVFGDSSGYAQMRDQVAGVPDDVPLETISVVLPCAYEGPFAGMTVESLLQHTSHSRLLEIIIVDDGSTPPLSSEFPSRLLSHGGAGPSVRIIRHEQTKGLIGAKKSGGNAARGDVIVFFDCHVRPRDGWEEAFLRQMKRAGDHRTVVVPTITSLDPDTWEEIPNGPVSTACYLLFSGDFTWLADGGRDVPLMSGGLLAISRQWWEETEGYDDKMIAWGGENIDQSLRTWLCGGRIEAAEGAFVAHMWRDPNNPKTQLKYPMPSRDVMRNKARAVSAWFDAFKEKAFLFPEYEDFITGQNQIGDMSNYDRLKAKLGCGSFHDYIRRFRHVYLDTGMIPEEIFQLRESKTGRCLERVPTALQHVPNEIILAPCAGGDEGGIAETQFWHLGNRDHRREDGPCCSGLMNWNFVQCLDGGVVGSHLQSFECEISGHAANQLWSLRDGELVLQDGMACAGPELEKLASGGLSPIESCETHVEPVGEETVSIGDVTIPESFRLRRILPDGRFACALVLADGDEWSLQFQICDATDGQQIFMALPLLGGISVKVGQTGMCLDAGGGARILVYPCYNKAEANVNQMWHIRGSHLVWERGHHGICVDFKDDGSKSTPLEERYELKTCASKPGQRLQKQDLHSDGSFQLFDPDADECLQASNSLRGELPSLELAECGVHARWMHLQERQQVQHVRTGLCIDAADNVHPILYPCHDPKAARPQRFQIVETPGWVQLMRGVEDNGRKRFFEMCLDRLPEAPVGVTIQQCKTASRGGVRWAKHNVRTTPEWEAWRQAQVARQKPLGLLALPDSPP